MGISLIERLRHAAKDLRQNTDPGARADARLMETVAAVLALRALAAERRSRVRGVRQDIGRMENSVAVLNTLAIEADEQADELEAQANEPV